MNIIIKKKNYLEKLKIKKQILTEWKPRFHTFDYQTILFSKKIRIIKTRFCN